MKVKFDFTMDDLVDSAGRTVSRSAVARGWRAQRLIVPCLLSAVVAYLVVPGSQERKLVAAVIAAAICAAIAPFSGAGSRKRRLEQYFREQFGGDGPFSCEVELTPAALVSTQRGMRTERAWPTITQIQVTDNSVDFITQGAGSLIVRNRAFASREERDAFVSLARSYAPQAR